MSSRHKLLSTPLKLAFTLIELLVTIAVIAVIAAAVLVAINPLDKIQAANDARAQADIGQVATALTTYGTRNNGLYPLNQSTWAGLGTALAGELTTTPTAPSGWTYNATTNATGTQAVIWVYLDSNKYTGVATSRCTGAAPAAAWFWNQSTGQACGICKATTATAIVATDTCAWYP